MAHRQTTTYIGSATAGAEFPPRPEHQRDIEKPRSVAFKPFSEMAIIPRDESESKLSYSSEDIRRFQQMMLTDVRQLRQDLASRGLDEISQGILYRCVGVERFLSQDILAQTLARNQEHIDAVLEEQQNQEQTNVHDYEKLSQVSSKSSYWSRCRAESIAAGYLHLRG